MMTTDADRLVERYILDEWLRDQGFNPHRCDTLHVVDSDAEDGRYGCSTGCEYVRFSAVVACDHQGPTYFQFGEFGNLAGIIEMMAADADSQGSA